jgi:mono/diheme cytochrome c family protein
MKRTIFTLALVLGVALALPAAWAKEQIALKSVNVSLPDSTRKLADGPGLAAVQGNCLACHSAGMILTQPTMPKAAWQAEVAKMRSVYKAPVDDKDVPAIVDYLTAVKGPK